MRKRTFFYLVQRYGNLIERATTHLRRTIPVSKRFAIALYFLAHAETYSEIAGLFQIGTSTVASIVHQFVTALVGPVTGDSIVFPVGRQLNRTMRQFEALSNLPFCAGSVDGTFMKIQKPEEYGDTYWCYKGFSAILLMACVDSKGRFTFVDIGAAGSVGDAGVFNNSQLKANIISNVWLNATTGMCGNAVVRPYLVGDSVFALTTTMMKIYHDDGQLTPQQLSFNAAQIRARRVVECAFGRLKGRFSVVHECNIKDPHFASQVGLLCCGLHNIVERRHVGYLPQLVNYEPLPLVAVNSSPAAAIREALAAYVHTP
ncbi:uncharacterized protein LOC135823569 [Sycon ciliatum]|uniref:uncharacterized protein LOC135823569 n=1 Tax=Sycon ciliatum TaxID=27933 RepID=UPI0031F64739